MQRPDIGQNSCVGESVLKGNTLVTFIVVKMPTKVSCVTFYSYINIGAQKYALFLFVPVGNILLKNLCSHNLSEKLFLGLTLDVHVPILTLSLVHILFQSIKVAKPYKISMPFTFCETKSELLLLLTKQTSLC